MGADGANDMARETVSCPICGTKHEVTVPVPQTLGCRTCQTTFVPLQELPRFTMHICKPGNNHSPAESHYSGRPFILPRPGDKVRLGDTTVEVTKLEFVFVQRRNGTRQVIYVMTKGT